MAEFTVSWLLRSVIASALHNRTAQMLHILASSSDQTVKLWDWSTGQCLQNPARTYKLDMFGCL